MTGLSLGTLAISFALVVFVAILINRYFGIV